jgi:hypothetical protein
MRTAAVPPILVLECFNVSALIELALHSSHTRSVIRELLIDVELAAFDNAMAKLSRSKYF